MQKIISYMLIIETSFEMEMNNAWKNIFNILPYGEISNTYKGIKRILTLIRIDLWYWKF